MKSDQLLLVIPATHIFFASISTILTSKVILIFFPSHNAFIACCTAIGDRFHAALGGSSACLVLTKY